MGEDEYESLGENASVSVTMTAGAMAGIMEHCIMFPVDCVKVITTARFCFFFSYTAFACNIFCGSRGAWEAMSQLTRAERLRLALALSRLFLWSFFAWNHVNFGL